jgi:glycosyltransferase involved in cell wall biosynthesis
LTATISVLTATFNSADVLPALIASLLAQSDADFEWVVVDGASSDATLELVRSAGLRKVVISEPDFGIYDALNKGLGAASGSFYLVLGSDDVLEPDAVANFRQALAEADAVPDMVSARVRAGTRVFAAQRGKAWLYGLQGYVSQHSVGTLIRRALHDRHGMYSRKFPIAADQFFIKKAGNAGAVIRYCDFVAGEYGTAGCSSVDTAGTLTEFFRVQLLTEKNKLLQVAIFLLRLLRHYPRL